MIEAQNPRHISTYFLLIRFHKRLVTYYSENSFFLYPEKLCKTQYIRCMRPSNVSQCVFFTLPRVITSVDGDFISQKELLLVLYLSFLGWIIICIKANLPSKMIISFFTELEFDGTTAFNRNIKM
jgi:hypothetical protein